MENKPVAWWDGKEPNVLGLAYHQNDYCLIPLYTHPHSEKSVKVKELTDEEILQVMMNVYSDTVPPIRGIEFAKAILRKASEK